MEEIFNNCGMGNIWLNPQSFNPLWIKKTMNLRLNDIFLQDWYSNISEMNSCITYKLFKSNLKLEKYLLELNTSDRINLCKFRCRNSKIPVVVMGYAHLNIPYEQRICTDCNLNEVGNEYHYIMKCNFFHSSRQKYLADSIWINPNELKFSNLFKSTNVATLRNLAKFVRDINKKFT